MLNQHIVLKWMVVLFTINTVTHSFDAQSIVFVT